MIKPQNDVQEMIYEYTYLEFKDLKFRQYLLQKLAFQNLNHKKIVQNTFLRYIQFNLDMDYGQWESAEFGQDPENINYIAKIIKSIPTLHNYNLDIFDNCICDNQDNLGALSKFFKCLPNSLNTLDFSIVLNGVGAELSEMKLLAKGFKGFPKKLQELNLGFDENQLGEKEENFIQLSNIFKDLPSTLTKLNMGLSQNDIGSNANNIKLFSESLKNLPKKLEFLELCLGQNQLNKDKQGVDYLIQGFRNLPYTLKTLKLSIDGGWDYNNKEKSKEMENILRIGEGFKYLPKDLSRLQLCLSTFDFERDFNFVDSFINSFKHLPKSLTQLELNIFGINERFNIDSFKYLAQSWSKNMVGEFQIKINLSQCRCYHDNYVDYVEVVKNIKKLEFSCR